MEHINTQVEMFETKSCRFCETEKPITSFYFRKDSNTYRTECNPCRTKQRKNKNKKIGSLDHIYYLWRDAKNRTRKNHDFNIDKQYVKTKLEETRKGTEYICPALKIKLVKGKKEWYNSPSIDRIDNNKGYVKGNIVIVSHLVNSMKSIATPDQILKVGKFYKKLYQEKGIVNG